MLQQFTCDSCGLAPLGVYFSYSMIRAFNLDDSDTPTCMSCKLVQYLDRENDHYKMEKRKVIQKWCNEEFADDKGKWKDAEGKPFIRCNTTDLPKFLDVFSSNGAQGKLVKKLARDLDELRKTDEAKLIFHETDEVQQPISAQAMGRRGHHGIRAPTLDDKRAFESGRMSSKWEGFRQDRINGHGQPRTFRG